MDPAECHPAVTTGRELHPSSSSPSDPSTDCDRDDPSMSSMHSLSNRGAGGTIRRQLWGRDLDLTISYDDSCADGAASVLSTHAGQGGQTQQPHQRLGARSLSPRSSAILQTSLRSAASSPGGLRYALPPDGACRRRPRSQRQDRLTRSEPSIPVTGCNSAENDGNHEAASTLEQLLRSPVAAPPSSVLELRRDNSLLDRPMPSHPATPATHVPPTTARHRYRIRHSPSSGSVVSAGGSSSGGTERDRVPRRRSAPATTALSTTATNHILLHVYDLMTPDTLMQLPFGCVLEIGQCFRGLNDGLHCLGTGAYHVGVEVNGTEYAYGACATPGKSGVFPCAPRQSPGYQYRTTLDFGPRPALQRSHVLVLGADGRPVAERAEDLERLDAREILRGLGREYQGTDYDILRRNCCTFARDVCLRFGIREEEIPTWFSNLAESGALTQDLALATVAPLKAISTCEADSAWREAYEVRIGGCC